MSGLHLHRFPGGATGDVDSDFYAPWEHESTAAAGASDGDGRRHGGREW